MKILGVILIVLSGTGIGFKAGENIHIRIQSLREIRKMLILIRGEIVYGVTAIDDAMENTAGRVNAPFDRFMMNIVKDIREKTGQTLCEIWNDNIDKLEGLCMPSKSFGRLKKFGTELGNVYKDMQISALDMYINELETDIRELDERKHENTRLCRTLGIMAGIFIAVILA